MLTEDFVVFNDRTKRIQLSKILSDIRKKHVFRGNRVNTHCELYRHNNEIQLAQAGKYLMTTLSWRKHYRNLSTICLVCLLFGILILVHFTCNYVRSAIIHVEVKWRRKQLESLECTEKRCLSQVLSPWFKFRKLYDITRNERQCWVDKINVPKQTFKNRSEFRRKRKGLS